MAITASLDKKTGKLTITIDINKTPTRSTSGKSMVVASTNGNVPLEGVTVVLGFSSHLLLSPRGPGILFGFLECY
jgi:hypothetical protein